MLAFKQPFPILYYEMIKVKGEVSLGLPFFAAIVKRCDLSPQ